MRCFKVITYNHSYIRMGNKKTYDFIDPSLL